MADVTIALLTMNAGSLLDRVLAAIDAQITSRKIERIAVDSGSRDDTPGRLNRAGFRVLRFDESPFNFGRAREFAYANASGEFILNLSQDAVPAGKDWLENLLRPFDDPSIAASCGRSVPDPARGFSQFAWERNGRFYFTREMKKFRSRHGRGMSFANSAVRRNVWADLHFDPIPIGEDFQFQVKLADTGLGIAFVDDAPVLHHHHYNLRNVFARCRNEGSALAQLGFTYGVADLVSDVCSPGIWIQEFREVLSGRARRPSEFLYPVIRPLAVFQGSRSRGEFVAYRPETTDA